MALSGAYVTASIILRVIVARHSPLHNKAAVLDGKFAI
jgi:hypothetical protein